MHNEQQRLPQWDDRSSPAELKEALAERRFQDAEGWVKALLADLRGIRRRVPAKTATGVLSALRAHAWFGRLHEVASELERGGQRDAEVLRQLAQARIEQGSVTFAIDALRELKARIVEQLEAPRLAAFNAGSLEFELGEVLGLLGRAYKQLYVDARPTTSEPRRHDLERALEFYGRALKERKGDYLWHGVNYVALKTHAERVRQGDPVATSDEAIEHAEWIAAEIDARERAAPLQPWDLANRAECLLAGGDCRRAVDAIQTYLAAPGLNAFNVQSTRRQLVQLWMLSEDQPPGSLILPMMIARLAELGGAEERVELIPADAPRYEKVWGATGYQPLQWLHQALERARCVARIGPDKYQGGGTGFLFDGAWIGDRFAGRHLLLTNAHVVSDDPKVQAQFPNPSGPEDNTAVFLGAGAGEESARELELGELLWTSPPTELDATLLEIEEPPEGARPPPLAKSLPAVEGPEARVNVIGHPRGFSVRVSLQDNQMVHVGDPYVHYRTPTDPGSSGSPVFNQRWQLVALHHASSSELSANEGVRMDRLLEAMGRDLR